MSRGTTSIPEVAVIIRDGDKILFVQRQHTGYNDGKYCMPGGHVEQGESFSAAAIREAFEEVGVHIKPEDLKPVFTMQRRKEDPADVRVAVIFEASKWSGTPESMEPERHGPVAWYEADTLPLREIMDFQADVLRGIKNGQQYAETGWDDA
jgi:ADP-ribose pyrophosphatase YjhB (NUDIX family)